VSRLRDSVGFARFRLINAGIFIVLGSAIAVRTVMVVGWAWAALPAYVLAIAMTLLGIVRFRDYLRAKRAAQ
jgi:hypothetical protein